jgi:ATP-dependent DNA helicase RecQ
VEIRRLKWVRRGNEVPVTSDDKDKGSSDVRAAARRLLGLESLRPGQAEAIRAALAGRDVLAVMPTGYGKSALYQVPGALQGGLSVVVSPLVALQRDQARAIGSHGGLPEPLTLDSRTGARQEARLWDALEAGGAHFLFLTPEQLAKDDVVSRLTTVGVSQLVVDEAHCISAWGHDFRPDYLQLGSAVDRLGRPPVMALTATASGPVRDEVVQRLGLTDPVVLVRGFDRPNLHLAVHRAVTDADKRSHVVETVAAAATEDSGCGLVYVATRRDTLAYAAELSERGLRSAAYHGGLRAAERRGAHERFSDGTVDVVVATSAFGMGIDRPDVRFVVHASVPQTPDAYYQEIGRAGRDGAPAKAVLFYRPEDFALQRFHASASVDISLAKQVVETVRHPGSATVAGLRRSLDASARTVTRTVNQLELAGVLRVRRGGVELTRQWRDTAARAAAEAAVDAAETRSRVLRTRLEMMRGYAETTRCRRQFLLGYLGEHLEAPCGRCDTCEQDERPAGHRAKARADDPFPAGTAVVHQQWGAGVVMDTDVDRLTVLFEREGYRTLSAETVQVEGLLSTA